MLTRFLSVALLASLAWPASTAAQEFVAVPGGGWVTDMTPDGAVVVGYGSGGAFYWRWKADPAPTFIGGVDAQGVSEDATVIVGCIIDPIHDREVAARWTEATGWVSLGYLPNAQSCPSRSNAYDVSADGNTIVGLSWDVCIGRGFRWTPATGMQELQPLGNPPDDHNRATTVSDDGSAIAGFAQGNFNRTPAYWNADTSGAVLDLNLEGEVNGFNNDGSESVGTMYFPGGVGGASGLYSAFRRTAAGVVTEIGALNPGVMGGDAQAISEDGSTIAGYDVIGLGREAWVWKASDGIISVTDRLTAAGVTGVPQVLVCTALSDDGNIIAGGAAGGPFNLGAGFIASLGPMPWANIGGGTIGIDGVPILKGTGTLVGGQPAGLELTHAPLFTLTLAWVSFAPTPKPAFGGTIHTHPYNKQFLFLTNNGEVNLNTTWPTGLPSGVEAYFQFLISDSSVFHEITLSNALKATTP